MTVTCIKKTQIKNKYAWTQCQYESVNMRTYSSSYHEGKRILKPLTFCSVLNSKDGNGKFIQLYFESM